MTDDIFEKILAFIWFSFVGGLSLVILFGVITLGVVLFYDVILPRISCL